MRYVKSQGWEVARLASQTQPASLSNARWLSLPRGPGLQPHNTDLTLCGNILSWSFSLKLYPFLKESASMAGLREARELSPSRPTQDNHNKPT